MKLYQMSDSEFAFWSPRSRASYALDKMKANSLTKSEAEKMADDDFKRILPNGLNSTGHFLFSAKDDQHNLIGFVWFCIHGADDNRRAFIYDLIVEEKYRHQGYGRQMMLLAEKEIIKNGIHRIGLHVFGFNQVAIRLYASLGYTVTDYVMEKSLV